MHAVGTATIAAKASPYQHDRYLTAIAEGRHVTSLALSEPGAGSHLYLCETTLRRDADAYVAEHLRSGCRHAANLEPPLTVSIGVAAYLPGDTDVQLIGRADAALYASKANGRDRFTAGGAAGVEAGRGDDPDAGNAERGTEAALP